MVWSLLDPKLLEWNPIQSDLTPWEKNGWEAGDAKDSNLFLYRPWYLIFRIFQNICRVSCTCCDLCMTKPRFGAVDKVFAPGIMLSVFCLTRVLKLRTWVLEPQMYHCCRWRMAFLRALSALRFGFQGLMPICRRFATQWGMMVCYGLLYVDIMVYSLLFLDPSVGHFIHLILFLSICVRIT